ncbi:MAG: hypothetical protein CVV35_09395, partial [Methanomicrobiales archaeon HGW-Methanomicrobiales-6]
DGYAGGSISYYDSKYGIPAPGDPLNPVHIDMHQTKVQLGSELEFADGFLAGVNLAGGYSDYSHGEVDATGVTGSRFDDEEWEGRAEFLHRAVGPFTGAIGVQLHRREIVASGEGGELLAPSETEAAAAFLFEEMPIAGETLKLQMAGRVEYADVSGRALDASIPLAPTDFAVSRSFTPTSVSVGLVYSPAPKWVFGVTAQHVERAPDALELFSKGPHEATETFEIGDPALGPLTEALGSEHSLIRMGAARVLERLGWSPGCMDEQTTYLIALQRWPEVVELGAPAADHLAVRFGDPDPAVKAGVAESLARLGSPAVSPLIGLLGEEVYRESAGDILVRIGEGAVEPLIRALSGEALRLAAAEVLVRMGRPAAGALVLVLAHPEIGPTAAEILVMMGEESLDTLVEALGNDDSRIRRRAGDVLISLEDAAVDSLIGALGHPNDIIRLEAIDTLTRVGRPIVAALTESLSDERYLVRLGAAEVLGRIGWEPATEAETVCYLIAKEQWASVAESGAGAVEVLIRTLSDPDTAIQMGAARALGMIGAPAVTRLIDELRSEQDGGQRKAVEALKMIGEPAVVPLVGALQDRDWQIRLGAARALVGIGDPAVEPLVRALRDAPPAVRMGAAATLGKIGNPGAVEPLIDALLSEDWRMGRVVVRALGMLGEPAVRPLLRVLSDGNDTSRKGAVAALVLIGEPAVRLLPGALTDGHFRVRAGVADVLDRLGWSPEPGEETVVYLIAKERWGNLLSMGPAAVGPLIAVLNDRDDSIRRRAAKVLGEIGDPRAVPALIGLLHDDYYSIRREAAAALGATGVPAMEPVVSALSDPDADVRKRAADVLSEIGDARAIEPLEGIFDDEDWYARMAAGNAVERIRERVGKGK